MYATSENFWKSNVLDFCPLFFSTLLLFKNNVASVLGESKGRDLSYFVINFSANISFLSFPLSSPHSFPHLIHSPSLSPSTLLWKKYVRGTYIYPYTTSTSNSLQEFSLHICANDTHQSKSFSTSVHTVFDITWSFVSNPILRFCTFPMEALITYINLSFS